MVETQLDLELSEQARFYVNRITDFFTVRDTLEKYPLDWYTSEVGIVGVHRDQLAMLVRKGIFGSYRMLHALGEGDIADGMVNWDRMMHGKE